MRVRAAAGLVAIVVAAPKLVAGETSGPLSTLSSGDRVRLKLADNGKSLRATVESVTADELVLQQPGVSEPLRLSLPQLRSLEVARGRSSHWLKGAVIGSIPGAIIAGFAGARSTCYYDDDTCFNGWAAVGGALVGGIATASVGALIGLAVRTDRWVKVHERKPKVALILVPTRREMRAGLSISF